MIRLINLTFILLVFNLSLLGQENLYDCDKSRTFADYLYNTGQYELSLHELERISYFCSFDSASQLMMLNHIELKYFERRKYSLHHKRTRCSTTFHWSTEMNM